MPHLDGKELAKLLRNMKSRYIFKIILVTAEEFEDKDNLYDNVLLKPVPNYRIIQLYNEIYMSQNNNM